MLMDIVCVGETWTGAADNNPSVFCCADSELGGSCVGSEVDDGCGCDGIVMGDGDAIRAGRVAGAIAGGCEPGESSR